MGSFETHPPRWRGGLGYGSTDIQLYSSPGPIAQDREMQMTDADSSTDIMVEIPEMRRGPREGPQSIEKAVEKGLAPRVAAGHAPIAGYGDGNPSAGGGTMGGPGAPPPDENGSWYRSAGGPPPTPPSTVWRGSVGGSSVTQGIASVRDEPGAPGGAALLLPPPPQLSAPRRLLRGISLSFLPRANGKAPKPAHATKQQQKQQPYRHPLQVTTGPERAPWGIREKDDLERAKIESSYQCEIDRLKSKIKETEAQLEASLSGRVDLQRKLNVAERKAANLATAMTRQGRHDGEVIDSEIISKFNLLRSDITGLAKNHFSVCIDDVSRDPSTNYKELWMMHKIATMLYIHFFGPNALMFGVDDELFEQNPLRQMERRLLDSNCDEAVYRQWRIASVKAARALSNNIDGFVEKVKEIMWREDDNCLAECCHHERYVGTNQSHQAKNELFETCRKAAELAILFRGSRIEYRWEQDPGQLQMHRRIDEKEHIIAGTNGVDHITEPAEIDFITFGGVVRGDKRTGWLRDSKARLCKTIVVARAVGGSRKPGEG